MSDYIFERVLEKLEPNDREYMEHNFGTQHKAFLALCKVIEEELCKTTFLTDNDMEL